MYDVYITKWTRKSKIDPDQLYSFCGDLTPDVLEVWKKIAEKDQINIEFEVYGNNKQQTRTVLSLNGIKENADT